MDSKFMRWPELSALLGVSRNTLTIWEEKEIFPHRINLGPNIVAWEREKVDEWIARKIEHKDI